jgi:hypothetical protein
LNCVSGKGRQERKKTLQKIDKLARRLPITPITSPQAVFLGFCKREFILLAQLFGGAAGRVSRLATASI